jgi:LmbE family N-acetylglucosaminyl deacetylase
MHRLLAITAHPDDEAASFGGTLALYARRGAAVEVVCATRGEAGRNRGNARTNAELAELRVREFQEACQLLGIVWQDIWDYPDRGLNGISLLDLGVRLCRAVRERRPDVILSLGLEGGLSGHPDHAAISHFAAFAFHAAGRSDSYPECGPPHQASRFYFATAPAPLPHRPEVCLSPVDVEIDISETFELKLAAFERHQTQAPLFERLRRAVQFLGPREYFHLAAGTVPHPAGLSADLFTGL